MRGKGQVQGRTLRAELSTEAEWIVRVMQLDTAGYRQVLCPPETRDTTGQKSDEEAVICQRLRASSSQNELYPGERESRVYKDKTIIISYQRQARGRSFNSVD